MARATPPAISFSAARSTLISPMLGFGRDFDCGTGADLGAEATGRGMTIAASGAATGARIGSPTRTGSLPISTAGSATGCSS